jgi:AcrR family transcriptional regulator
MSARKLDAEKRTQFLNSALKLFVEKGVQNTSTAAIAKDAGTAAGTLFLYFPTKQDLINELVLEITREQAKNTQAQLHPDLSVRETFFAIWDSTIRWFMTNIDAYQYVQLVRDTGWLDDQVAAETAQYFGYFYTAIQAGLTSGVIAPYPLELIGEILYRQIVAVMNLIKVQPDPIHQKVYIQAGFEIFWNGIKT